ncbi:MAG: BrnT family toxin [Deltaproteobacteria bacterium]
MQFEWDPDKAAANLAKHEISFQTAQKAFSDRGRVERFQRRSGEDRWKVIGAVGDQLLAVIYAEVEVEGSDELVIRIISARKATKLERKTYRTQR